MSALATVAAAGPVRVSEVAELMGLDLSTVSRQVSHLRRDGLVESTPDADDGRSQRLSVTDAGRALLRDERHRMVDRLVERLVDWDDAELAEITALIGPPHRRPQRSAAAPPRDRTPHRHHREDRMTTTAARPSTAAASPPTAPAGGDGQVHMTHRQILEALSGLLLGMFVAILSSTVVSNALPVILPALGGGESGYTWVVVAALLATTVSTPIWGKLADIFSKKVLVQTSLVIFVIASVVAGLSVNVPMLIAARVGQGLGAGGLTALAQIVLATMIAPRERGRYSGYLGATFALATVGGPLIGGVITEHLSWHYTFFVASPSPSRRSSSSRRPSTCPW
ncbi:MAG: MFS transporter [Quadrisphaera sp.]